ncbi:8-oxo-dGTP diphosphatase MutT [Alteromonas halophila]|uniref:8-oxo-dGTP diphosphatase n=1 Tax=Alteromonas halophila TaxID=516698 RepID=A0A918N0I3_9ALTE|nr:8-oxo-dGTP diphosphatase MutT [Alteromonas halophila]GGW94137.1 hypothetical protein GCM10007391_30560 [Alteromonas halophila]
MKTVHVAVGVILRDGQTFVCLRGEHQHQGGKWEFPGGKVDEGETVAEALSRELAEEVGITVTGSEPLTVIRHAYPDKQVVLDVHKVTAFDGEPHGKEGQQSRWQTMDALKPDDFPAANREIIAALQQ